MVRIYATQSIPFSSGGRVLARYDNRSEEMGPIGSAFYGVLDRVFGPLIPATLRDSTLIPSKEAFTAAEDTFTRNGKKFEEADLVDIFIPAASK